MTLAVTLRDRLPKVAALFLDGRVSARTVGTIAWRTNLVVDAGALDAIDTDIAGAAARWGRLSQQKLERAVDAAVARRDPAAVHRVRTGLQEPRLRHRGRRRHHRYDQHLRRDLEADAALLDEAITALINWSAPTTPHAGAAPLGFHGSVGRPRHPPAVPLRKDTCRPRRTDPIAARFVVHLLARPTPSTLPGPDWDGGREDDADDDAEEDNEGRRRGTRQGRGPRGAHTEESEPEPAPHRPRGIGIIPGMPGTGLLDGGQVADLIARPGQGFARDAHAE